ncbi:MAG: DUF4397 domain-containing protein [Anaerolineae bacterium]|nr:DUF4397 domain-containing protein [Anaerolineae bacterium]
MKRLAWIRTLLLLVMVAAGLAACDTGEPPPITVVVPITAVDDTVALENAVNEALTGTAAVNFAQTATVAAQGGITYTPSATYTPSVTPTFTPTRFVTSTATPRPTETPTVTFAPLNTNTPQAAAEADTAWLRVLHAYSDLAALEDETGSPFDIYVNDQRIQRSLLRGEGTGYLQVVPGTVRVTLRTVDDFLSATEPQPVISQTIEIPAGSATAVIIRNEQISEGDVRLGLLPLREDASPLGTGRSRLTILHSNPELLPINAILSDRKQAIAYNFTAESVIGPLDVDSGDYTIDLFDSKFPDQYIGSLPTIQIASYRNYIVVLSPYRGADARLTDALVFSGSTRIPRGEVFARFINAAETIGNVRIHLNQQSILPELAPGEISDPVPVPVSGSLMTMSNQAGADLQISCQGSGLGPWQEASEVESDKLILLTSVTGTGGTLSICANTLSLNPPTSSINASLRMINMLPNSVPLLLQVRPIRFEQVQTAGADVTTQEIGEDRNPWVTLTDTAVRLGAFSDYITRIPGSYAIRIVPSGTANTLAGLEQVQLSAGGIYDLIVLPGDNPGSAQLIVVQPQVQITNLAINEGDPEAIAEAVQATLTAAAPRVTSTPTQASTPTATPTPVLTNTPRPTNTPNVLPPAISVDLVPPNQVIGGTFTLRAVNFAPGRRYSVVLDSIGEEIATGTVEPNGSFSVVITIPPELQLAAGPQSVSVTVNRPDGIRQVAYALILLADVRLTPSPTP